MTEKQRSVLAFFLRSKGRSYGVIFLMGLLVAALDLAAVLVILPLVSGLVGLPVPGLGRAGKVLDAALAAVPMGATVEGKCLLVIALTLLKSAVTILTEYAIARTSSLVQRDIINSVWDAYAGAPYQYFLDTRQGEMSYVVLISSQSMSRMSLKLPQIGIALVQVLALAAFLFWLEPWMTLGLAAFALGLNRLMTPLSTRISYDVGRRRREELAGQSALFTEFVSGFKQVFAFGVKDHWVGRLKASTALCQALYVKEFTLIATPKPLMEAAATALIFGSMLALAWLRPGEFARSLPFLAVLVMSAAKMLPALSHAHRSWMELLACLPEIEHVHQLIVAGPTPPPGGERRFGGLGSAVRLEEVRFAYPGRPELLRGGTIAIPRNRTTAIVGESGSGKTTVVNLLLGLYRPAAGRVAVDGTDLREFDLRSWLDRVAVVTQDTFLFNGTVADNIAFGRKEATRERVERAARIAQAHEFISALPSGYETAIGERGMKLSGGQQQRIAIALAVLGDPEILVFDEATSSLDTRSEAAVQSAIRAVSEGRTVVQISHRLASVADSHSIVVLHEGAVAESGTHGELLAAGGRYAALLRKQGEPAPGPQK